MRILLDTCTFLWLASDPDKISETVRNAVDDSGDALYLSVVSAWEIGIKYKRGQLRLPIPPERYVPERIGLYGLSMIDIALPHAIRVGSLPFHHKDPFDRMLIAQAEVEGLVIATPDGAFAPYGVPIVW